jgi:hypothetical protein
VLITHPGLLTYDQMSLAVRCPDVSYKGLDLPCIYLEMLVTNQDYIHEEIKSKLNSGNACYHAVQNILSSHLLSKNVKIKIHKAIICYFL